MLCPFCCLARIRTLTNRTKTCCATITPRDSLSTHFTLERLDECGAKIRHCHQLNKPSEKATPLAAEHITGLDRLKASALSTPNQVTEGGHWAVSRSHRSTHLWRKKRRRITLHSSGRCGSRHSHRKAVSYHPSSRASDDRERCHTS